MLDEKGGDGEKEACFPDPLWEGGSKLGAKTKVKEEET